MENQVDLREVAAAVAVVEVVRRVPSILFEMCYALRHSLLQKLLMSRRRLNSDSAFRQMFPDLRIGVHILGGLVWEEVPLETAEIWEEEGEEVLWCEMDLL